MELLPGKKTAKRYKVAASSQVLLAAFYASRRMEKTFSTR